MLILPKLRVCCLALQIRAPEVSQPASYRDMTKDTCLYYAQTASFRSQIRPKITISRVLKFQHLKHCTSSAGSVSVCWQATHFKRFSYVRMCFSTLNGCIRAKGQRGCYRVYIIHLIHIIQRICFAAASIGL